MRAKPIIFRADMVLAILEGRKTQTRRAWKGVHQYAPGHVLWVKEPLVRGSFVSGKFDDIAMYEADGEVALLSSPEPWLPTLPLAWKWKRDKLPAMYMPRVACRLRLEVVGVWRERLDEITQADAEVEVIEFRVAA